MKPTHAKLTLPRCSWLLSLMLFIVFHAVGAGQAPSINEVESNGGTPGDWFELINTGSSPVDVSGWKMLDGDDTHAPYVFPAGSTIAAGAYLVVEEAQFGFGLGAADSVRIYNSSGALFETYAWTAHAATTYGRCPNGTGAFITTTTSTKGAANDCSSPVKINEVESNLGVPGDWIELFNPSASPVNLAGFVVKDNDDTHNYTIPAGTTIAAGGYLVVEEAQLGFGLGSADSARLFDTTATIVDSYTWTAHAATTYGRCPNGLGGFITTSSATKGTANDCGVAVKISEVESNLGVPGDWIELVNPGVSTADLSGFVLRDNDDTHTYAIPGGTLLAPGAYLVVEEAALGFGLGAADSARLFDTAGGLVDSYSWTAHAATTYGRCPTPTGDFTTTTAPTKGTLNACPGVLSFSPWPGGQDVKTVDGTSVFGGNLSGLVYEGTGTAARGVLWAARNGPGSVFRMIFNGTIWVPDTTNSWGSGKLLAYPGGTGSPDSEGITFAGGSSNGGLYISVERDNNVNSISRNSILRVDPLTPGATLTATHEWNLTADLPVTGPNLGAEAVAWISDAYLTANNFFDESKNHTYNPSEYPNHGTGLFFVGLEANGNIYGYALDHSGNGAFTRLATITTGLTGVMDLQLDPVLGDFWAICDDTCQGRSLVLRIDGSGKFVVAAGFERPTSMPNLNNEGFAITSECLNPLRPVFWSDDSETDGHSIRSGWLSCLPIVKFKDTIAPKASPTVSPTPSGSGWNMTDVTVQWNWLDNPGGSGIDAASCTVSTASSGEGTQTLNGSCKDLAGNIGTASFTVKVDKSNPTIAASAKKADGSAYTFGTWSNQAVTVHYTCADSGSGIASCTSDQVFTADGSVSTNGTAKDNVGRTAASAFVLVRIDKALPRANLTNPILSVFPNTSVLLVEWLASDPASGIAKQAAALDGKPVSKGLLDLFNLPLGPHTIKLTVTDNAGNTATDTEDFTISVSAASLSASIVRLTLTGDIDNVGTAISLIAKVSSNSNRLSAFLKELDTQRAKRNISQNGYNILRAAALYLMSHS